MLKNHQSFALLYHEQTKYCPQSIADSARQVDPQAKVSLFKNYEHLDIPGGNIDLSCYIPLTSNPFSGEPIKKCQSWTAEEQELAFLSRLLYFSYGITGLLPCQEEPLPLRASPSAGGLYPNELYVIACDMAALEDGIYHYDAQGHTLQCCSSLERETVKALSAAIGQALPRLSIVTSAIFQRSYWRYRERAYRRILLDTGHILGNLQLLSAELGRPACLIGGFSDQTLNLQLQLKEEEEQALCFVVFPEQMDLTEKAGRQTAYSPLFNNSIVPCADAAVQDLPGDLSLMHSLHRSSYLEEEDLAFARRVVLSPKILQSRVWERLVASEQLPLERLEWQNKCELFSTILKRRSCRQYLPESVLSLQALREVLSFALDANSELLSGEMGLLQNYLIVNDVAGLEPGCYKLSICQCTESLSLQQTRFRSQRKEIHQAALGQALARDASALLVQTCDLSHCIERLGDRVYRYLHMDAGHIGQRASLAAVKLGLGASGIAGFFDEQVGEVLGLSSQEIVLYITTLGIAQR